MSQRYKQAGVVQLSQESINLFLLPLTCLSAGAAQVYTDFDRCVVLLSLPIIKHKITNQ